MEIEDEGPRGRISHPETGSRHLPEAADGLIEDPQAPTHALRMRAAVPPFVGAIYCVRLNAYVQSVRHVSG